MKVLIPIDPTGSEWDRSIEDKEWREDAIVVVSRIIFSSSRMSIKQAVRLCEQVSKLPRKTPIVVGNDGQEIPFMKGTLPPSDKWLFQEKALKKIRPLSDWRNV